MISGSKEGMRFNSSREGGWWIETMPERLQAVLDANGSHTKW